MTDAIPSERESFSIPESPIDAGVWLRAIALALCILGLGHDTAYLGATADNSVEQGEGIETEEKFQQDVGAAPLHRKLGFAGLALVGASCCIGLPRGVRISWGPVTWFVAMTLMWTVLSYQWSADRHETGRELVRVFVYAGVALALARRFDVNQLCFILMFTLAASMGFAVLAEVATGNFRPWLADYRMQGTLHTNVLARQAVLVGIAALSFMGDPRYRNVCRAVLVAAVAVMLLTKSRTGLVTFLAGVAALRLMSSSFSKLALLGCTMIALVGGGLMLSTFGGSWLQRQTTAAMTLGRNEDVTSLTGRLPLWQSIWNEARDRKITGFGYGAFWLPEKTEDIGAELKWYPRHAHSAYVEIVVNLGLVGLVLVLGTALAGASRAANLAVSTEQPEFRLITALIVCALVNGIAEAAFVLPRDLALFGGAGLLALVFMHPRLLAILEGPAEAAPVPSFAAVVARRRSQLAAGAPRPAGG